MVTPKTKIIKHENNITKKKKKKISKIQVNSMFKMFFIICLKVLEQNIKNKIITLI